MLFYFNNFNSNIGIANINIVFRPYLLENQSFSRVVFDRNGKVLKLTLNNEDKYRLFVPLKQVPDNLKKSVILYEDRYLYYHPVFNPFSLARAFFLLFGGKKLGTSTITIQVARITNDLNTKTIGAGQLQQIY